MFRSVLLLSVAACALSITPAGQAHDGHDDYPNALEGVVAEWVFQPDYRLPRQAGIALPRVENPAPMRHVLAGEPTPLRFLGAVETDRQDHLLDRDHLPTEAFTVEMWILDHVKDEVGALAGVMTQSGQGAGRWALGRVGSNLVFGLLDEVGQTITVDIAQADLEPHNHRWRHLVGSYDGEVFRVYHNGRLIGVSELDGPLPAPAADARFGIASFTAAEPYMALENYVQAASLYQRALNETEIQSLFERRVDLVEAGQIYEDLFHFTAGPALNLVTTDSMSLVVETNEASQVRVRYGAETPLAQELISSEPGRLHTFEMTGLDANSSYFYTVSAANAEGEQIETDLMTFKTAVEPGTDFSFAIIGDTEARPFINDVVAKAVWTERPDFAVILGDLTDGGFAERRFEWTHEYFMAMNQLAHRTPLMAVPGNGEGDLVWFNHYHAYPGEEHFYTFNYGDTQFFMLDSNLSRRERDEPGFRARQRAWLAEQLEQSSARWKIAVHHHPVWSGDENDYGDSWREAEREYGDARVRNDFMDLYDQYEVDMVLYGHIHSYERTHPARSGGVDRLDGVIYIAAGGGGGSLEDFSPTPNWFTRATYPGHHYGMFHVTPDTVRFVMRDTEGRVRDSFTLVKGETGRGVLIENAVADHRQNR